VLVTVCFGISPEDIARSSQNGGDALLIDINITERCFPFTLGIDRMFKYPRIMDGTEDDHDFRLWGGAETIQRLGSDLAGVHPSGVGQRRTTQGMRQVFRRLTIGQEGGELGLAITGIEAPSSGGPRGWGSDLVSSIHCLSRLPHFNE
jgi:hypothetical protein